MEIRTILVATDFSSHAERAFDWALELAARLGARVRVLHAYPLPYVGVGLNIPLPAEYFDGLREGAQQHLDAWAEKARAQGIEATTELLAEDPSTCIVESAHAHPTDLIVMGTRGLTGLGHVLLGSVADRTVRRAPCPVLVVPDKA